MLVMAHWSVTHGQQERPLSVALGLALLHCLPFTLLLLFLLHLVSWDNEKISLEFVVEMRKGFFFCRQFFVGLPHIGLGPHLYIVVVRLHKKWCCDKLNKTEKLIEMMFVVNEMKNKEKKRMMWALLPTLFEMENSF